MISVGMNQRVKLAVLSHVLIFSVASAGHAGSRASSVVKASATATKLDETGKQTVTVKLAIKKGFFVYANPVKNGDFDPIKTTVVVRAKGKLAGVDIRYPLGKLYRDERMPQFSFMIYEGDIDITALVQHAPGDSGPLEVEVRFCTSDCAPPATVKFTLPSLD